MAFLLKPSYCGIRVRSTRDALLTKMARKLLATYYCKPGETSPQQAFARAAAAYVPEDEMDLAQRVYDAVSQGWVSFASPVLSNAPLPGEKVKALPISCFLTYVDDSLDGLIGHTAEVRWMSCRGGGVGAAWSAVRSVSDVSPGPIPFLGCMNADMGAYRQGKTRKGSCAVYLDVSHPDIREFLGLRTPTGDISRKCLNLHHGVNLPDAFMNAVLQDQPWKLVDPHSKEVKETVRARDLWETILETRYRTGEPFLFFTDTANRDLPQPLKDKGLKIHCSNLCTEIHIPTDNERSGVCCLSSLNLEKIDEWKDSGLVGDMIRFLDHVLQFFIDHCDDTLQKARFSATQSRDLGLGAMGFHSYLQVKSIPFESEQAREVNRTIFQKIRDEAVAMSRQLAKEKGEAPDMVGTGLRNANVTAIAPNSNSSLIAGCSASVEPIAANAYTHRSRIGSNLIKSTALEKLLQAKDRDTPEVWSSIVSNKGSVQHLEFLTDHEKAVFKTAPELDQMSLIRLAGERQPFISMGQSINTFFPYNESRTTLHKVHMGAWRYGLKTLYYLRTTAAGSGERISASADECISCQA